MSTRNDRFFFQALIFSTPVRVNDNMTKDEKDELVLEAYHLVAMLQDDLGLDSKVYRNCDAQPCVLIEDPHHCDQKIEVEFSSPWEVCISSSYIYKGLLIKGLEDIAPEIFELMDDNYEFRVTKERGGIRFSKSCAGIDPKFVEDPEFIFPFVEGLRTDLDDLKKAVEKVFKKKEIQDETERKLSELFG